MKLKEYALCAEIFSGLVVVVGIEFVGLELRRYAIQANTRGDRGLGCICEQPVEGTKQRGRRVGGRARIRKRLREIVAEQVPHGERDQRAAIRRRQQQRDR